MFLWCLIAVYIVTGSSLPIVIGLVWTNRPGLILQDWGYLDLFIEILK